MESKMSTANRLPPVRAGIGGIPLNARNPNSKLQTISSPVSLVPIESLETVRVIVWREAPKRVAEGWIIDHSSGRMPMRLKLFWICYCCAVTIFVFQGIPREGGESPSSGRSYILILNYSWSCCKTVSPCFELCPRRLEIPIGSAGMASTDECFTER